MSVGDGIGHKLKARLLLSGLKCNQKCEGKINLMVIFIIKFNILIFFYCIKKIFQILFGNYYDSYPNFVIFFERFYIYRIADKFIIGSFGGSGGPC